MQRFEELVKEAIVALHGSRQTLCDGRESIYDIEARAIYITALEKAYDRLSLELFEIKRTHDREIETQKRSIHEVECLLARVKLAPAPVAPVSIKAPVQPLPVQRVLTTPSVCGELSPVRPLEEIQAPQAPQAWKTIKSKARRADSGPTSAQAQITIVEGISLTAHHVKSLDECTVAGQLYYIEQYDHFAMKLGTGSTSPVVHGNIGNIFENTRSPYKVNACLYGEGCIRRATCDYYHDPICNKSGSTGSSREYRNYVKTNWIYTGHSSDSPYTRHFGSRDRLVEDLAHATQEEIARFGDQIMHDVLCYLAALSAKN